MSHHVANVSRLLRASEMRKKKIIRDRGEEKHILENVVVSTGQSPIVSSSRHAQRRRRCANPFSFRMLSQHIRSINATAELSSLDASVKKEEKPTQSVISARGVVLFFFCKECSNWIAREIERLKLNFPRLYSLAWWMERNIHRGKFGSTNVFFRPLLQSQRE